MKGTLKNHVLVHTHEPRLHGRRCCALYQMMCDGIPCMALSLGDLGNIPWRQRPRTWDRKNRSTDRAPRARAAGVLSPSSMEDRNLEVSIGRPWRAPPASENQRITPPPSRSSERSRGHANGGRLLPSTSYNHASANTLQVDVLAFAPSVAHLCDAPRPYPVLARPWMLLPLLP